MHQWQGLHHAKPPSLKTEISEPMRPEDSVQPAAGTRLSEVHAHLAEHAGHDKHAGHSVAMFRRKFWVSLVLTLPTLVWGHMLHGALGYTAPHFLGSMWIPVMLGTAVFAFGGWVFIQGAMRELRDRLPGMMTLIALGISVAFIFSVAVMLGFPGVPLWEELSTLVTIMLLAIGFRIGPSCRPRGR
jgi:P-type Cu2+ transporter